MKMLVSGLVLLNAVCFSFAANHADLDARIRKLTWKLEEMQAKPDKRIPPEMLRQAQGVILLDRTKAGFLFAYQGGAGVALLRDPVSRQWSAPVFVKANEASLGFQIGGQQSFVVILLMNTNAAQLLLQPNFRFGGEAGGTAGNASGGVEGSIATAEPLVAVYTDRAGLFGGAALKGDSLSTDNEADVAYYDRYLSGPEILFERKVRPSPAAQQLIGGIEQFSK